MGQALSAADLARLPPPRPLTFRCPGGEEEAITVKLTEVVVFLGEEGRPTGRVLAAERVALFPNGFAEEQRAGQHELTWAGLGLQ